jgi:hypothetical protein
LVNELVGASVEAVSLLDGLVQDATRVLFESYGLKLELDGTSVAKTLRSIQLLSMIGFASPALSGSLLLGLPDAIVLRTLPAPDASVSDWSGELANQLMGRLKNQLLKYQVVINPGLPVVVTGGTLQLPKSSRRQVTRYFSFVSEQGKMFIRLDMEISPSLELVRQADRDRDVSIDEGELLLF